MTTTRRSHPNATVASVWSVEDLQRLAYDTVSWFLNDWTPRPDDNAFLEVAEVVELEPGGPGVLLLWTQTTYDQGQRRFGLLMSVQEMAEAHPQNESNRDSADQWLPHLALAVVEPHGTPASAAVRTWFRYIP
jgi:hypothetical protein